METAELSAFSAVLERFVEQLVGLVESNEHLAAAAESSLEIARQGHTAAAEASATAGRVVGGVIEASNALVTTAVTESVAGSNALVVAVTALTKELAKTLAELQKAAAEPPPPPPPVPPSRVWLYVTVASVAGLLAIVTIATGVLASIALLT